MCQQEGECCILSEVRFLANFIAAYFVVEANNNVSFPHPIWTCISLMKVVPSCFGYNKSVANNGRKLYIALDNGIKYFSTMEDILAVAGQLILL